MAERRLRPQNMKQAIRSNLEGLGYAADCWVPATLGGEIDLLTGFPFQSKQYTEAPGGIPLVRGDNVAQGRLRWDGVKRWPSHSLDGLYQYELQEDDVVLAMDRPWIEAGLKYAAVSKQDLPCLLVQRVARLRGGQNLDTRFLRYLIGSRGFTEFVLGVQTGTAVPHISGGQIKAFEFLRPPLAEQRGIAHILGTLDDKIELNRRMNETLEGMARAIFKSWFVDFDPVRAKAEGGRRKAEGGRRKAENTPGLPKPIADLFPDSFEDSELGKIPKGWEIMNPKELMGLVIGGDWGKDTLDDEFTQPAFCIRGADIPDLQSGGIGKMPTRYVKPSSLEKRSLQPGDLAFEISGGSPTQSTGRPVLITPELLERVQQPIICSNFCRLIRPNKSCCSYFLYFMLRHLYHSDEFLQFENGTTGIKNFAFTVFCDSYKLVVPTVEVQRAFRTKVASLVALRGRNGMQTKTLAALRDTLLPKLLSGEIRVANTERLMEAAL